MTHADKLHLFGIPYAGGSATATYGRWATHLPDTIKVVPLELAGHGRRMSEPFCESIEAAVANFLATIMPTIREAPYALYGHSMGTIIVYELIKAIADAKLPAPRAVFFSGRNPPHHAYSNQKLSLLNNEMFLEAIRKLGGTPEEFFKMKELINAFLPILRSDYRMIDQYEPGELKHVTSADLVFFMSNNDTMVSKSTIHEWSHYTNGSFSIREFEGGHFFIHDYAKDICHIIADTLKTVLS